MNENLQHKFEEALVNYVVHATEKSIPAEEVQVLITAIKVLEERYEYTLHCKVRT